MSRADLQADVLALALAVADPVLSRPSLLALLEDEQLSELRADLLALYLSQKLYASL